MSAPGRLRVLWLTAETPHRALGGGNVRQSYLLERLARDADVTLLTGGQPPDPEVTRAAASIEVLPDAVLHRWHPPRGGRVQLLADAVLPGGPSERRALARARRRLVAAVRRQAPADVVLVEHTGLAPLVRHRRQGERWVLTMHNLPSVSAEQALELADSPAGAWLVRREVRAARRFEAWSIRMYDRVITVGANDASRLPAPTTIVANGVDLSRFPPTPLPAAPSVVFTGTLDYPPNVDGVVWFCEQIWPRVRRAVPAASLVLAGRQPLPQVRALDGRDGVRVIADPAETSPLIAAARVAVVPLRQGSGTRLKALEALASGRPVVGTTIGLAGLGIEDGRDALVRDDPVSTADAVISLLTGDRLAAPLAGRGPEFAAGFAWPVIGDRFTQCVLEAASRGGRGD